MKVLFAVKNESLSNAIIEKYRRKYKEILTFKNVYYYNAIIKELQKNKDYDRILISEELEDFANNNNYDTIDKFIFDKLDSISDEANDANGREISIIFICTDRRQKGDELLSKLFSIGVYNALIGDDRTYDSVCSLIKNPRTKKDAKNYYKIDIESSNYRAENENGVSEVEIQNILAHFRRLGKSTEKFAKSFDNIAAQYNEEQLRIIANCLPPKVKSVLATTSEKYKKLATTGFGLGMVSEGNSNSSKKPNGIRVNTLDNTTTKSKITKPIVIPAGVKKVKPKNVENSEETTSGIRIQRKPTSLQEQIKRRAIDEKERIAALKKQKEIEMQELGETQKVKEKAPEKEKKPKAEVKPKEELEDEDIFADEIFNDEPEVKNKAEKFDEDIFDDVSDKKEEIIKKVPEKVEKADLTLDDEEDDDFNFNEDFLEDVEDVIDAEDEPEFEIRNDEPEEFEDEDEVEEESTENDFDDDGFDFDDSIEETENVIEAPKTKAKQPETDEFDDDEEFDFEDAVLETSDDIEVNNKPESKRSEPEIEDDEDDEFDFADDDDDMFGDSTDFEEEPKEEPKETEPEIEEDEDDEFDFGDDDDDIFGDSTDFEEEPKEEPKKSEPEVEDEDDEFDFGDDDIFGDSDEIEKDVAIPQTNKSTVDDEDDLFDDIADIPGIDEFDDEKEADDTSDDNVFEDSDDLFDDIADIPGLDDDIEEKTKKDIQPEPTIDVDDIDEDDNMFDDMVDIPGLDDLDDFEDSTVKDVQPKTEPVKSAPEENDDFEEFDEDIFGDEEDLPLDNNDVLPDDKSEDDELFEDTSVLPGMDEFDDEIFEDDVQEKKNVQNSQSQSVESIKPKVDYSMSNLNKLLTKDKKIVNFLGTTKNGTSFLVNNLAKLFSSIGVNTAILDMTKNRNSYYIFTNNDEELRKIAQHSFEKLETGYAEGIRVDKNLTVYTNLPTDERIYKNAEAMFSTLLQNHTLILVDCDFDTDTSFFALCQELYLIQSLDILTMQPLTTFLRTLQIKDILEPEKLRVVINKDIKVRDLTPKAIIGGMSYYKDPGMSVMVELFNKDMVQACSIPFEDNTYSKYLEAIANCEISLSGYSKAFMAKLKNLGEMIYSLNSKPSYASSPITQDYNTRNKFSNNMNNTLKEMKKKF